MTKCFMVPAQSVVAPETINLQSLPCIPLSLYTDYTCRLHSEKGKANAHHQHVLRHSCGHYV